MCHHYDRSYARWERVEESKTDKEAGEPAEEMDTPGIETPEIAEPETETPEVADD
jgi:hypothetical protein